MFIKTGDPNPILGYTNIDGDPQLCVKCDRPLTTLDLKNDKLVCPDCEEETMEDLNGNE